MLTSDGWSLVFKKKKIPRTSCGLTIGRYKDRCRKVWEMNDYTCVGDLRFCSFCQPSIKFNPGPKIVICGLRKRFVNAVLKLQKEDS